MEEHNTPHPQIIPQAPEPAIYGSVGDHVTPPVTPAPPSTPKKRFFIPPWMVAIVILVVLVVVGSAFVASLQRSSQTITPTPTPTATASAISNRVLSSIASQSAFTKFETDLDNLTRGVQNVQVQNQQLLPPRIDLPLGF